MSTNFSARDHVRQYITQHIYLAQVSVSHTDGQCVQLIDRLIDSFFAANPKLIPTIDRDVINAPSTKMRSRINTWKDRLRKASSAYCRGLYVAFDLSDLFLKPNGEPPIIK